MKDEDRPEIDGAKMVWLVKRNSDLNEGRGHIVVAWVCDMKATAIRHAHKAGVQGTDAQVEEAVALFVMVDGKRVLYVPGQVEKPTKEDKKAQKKQDELEEVLYRAAAAGLTDEDLKILRGSK